ncbi:SDR family NAD(P)-dependent oxidoreductase [Fodinibius sp.]|uniref:SDR family NAD(P)-dependent oxidoreductase n=1 Tax=Fodinibius sp. TaxID=1872440 RepID=UPI002ACE499F|nr:SDR family NAD(P)-dependent oxidoreductase [Fodinibius sp.]MDZ7659567.1 SDR family NAD(P)-dependent oxidoreductase [Fodinibius sp.]
MKKKVAIIGATSGIGRALAVEMHNRGYTVGATGRRLERLEELRNQLKTNTYIQYMDVTDLDDAISQLDQLKKDMGGLDIIVLNSGVSNYQQESVGREPDLHVIDVNVRGFANLGSYAFNLFEEQGHGHIVGISSVAGLFGWGLNIPYNASKSFVNTYLQGYRQKANHSDADIAVSTIMPGFVESEMTEGKKDLFWVQPTKKAAKQIAEAIEKQKNEAYITKRWRLVGWFVKLIPNWAWNRM